MIYPFINTRKSPLGRRIVAALALLLLPLLVVLALVCALALHVWDFLREFYEDFKVFFIGAIPGTVSDMCWVLKTGNKL